jgi:hypothetical protein
MADIGNKVRSLEFTATTKKSQADVRRLLHDAAEVAQGERISLSDASHDLVKGVARNFVRVQHAVFIFALKSDENGTTSVEFRILDYLRTRKTLLSFIPVSPWSAPACKTLKEFSAYVRERL